MTTHRIDLQAPEKGYGKTLMSYLGEPIEASESALSGVFFPRPGPPAFSIFLESSPAFRAARIRIS
jgi:hypothetical protein